MFNKHNLYPIFGGRWQPFHNGHLWAIKQIIAKYKHVIIMFVNIDPQNPPAHRFDRFLLKTNPLDYWERYFIIMRALIAENLWDHVIIVPGWHPREVIRGEQFCLPPKSKRVWMVPVNSEEELSKISDLEDRGEIVEKMEHIPGDIMGLNATIIRSAIINDSGDWNRYVPEVLSSLLSKIDIKNKILSVYDSKRFVNSLSGDISTVVCVGEYLPFSQSHIDFIKKIAPDYDTITLGILIKVEEHSDFSWPELTYSDPNVPLNYWDINQLIRAALSEHPEINFKTIIHPILTKSLEFKLNLNNLPQNRDWYFLNNGYRFIEDELISSEENVNAKYLETAVKVDDITERLINETQANYLKSVSLTSRLRAMSARVAESKKAEPSAPTKVDIGIVTIVTSEKIAVRDCIIDAFEVNGRLNPSRRYIIGKVKGRNDVDHSVALYSQVEEGQSAASSAYKSLVAEFNPRILFLIGIGGSIDPKVQKCDAVIADKIIYYEIKKETIEGDLRSARYLENSDYVKDLIGKFFEVYTEYPVFDAVENSKNKQFKVYRGPIGSGETVVTLPDSPIIKYLKKVDRKTLCVEMEGYGFAHAFYDEGGSNPQRSGFVVIRGISDKPIEADEDKDSYRKPCCDNAVQIMLKMIKLIPKMGDKSS